MFDEDNYEGRMQMAWLAATPEERKEAIMSYESKANKNGKDHPAVQYSKACGHKGSYEIKDPFYTRKGIPLWVVLVAIVGLLIIWGDIVLLWWLQRNWQ